MKIAFCVFVVLCLINLSIVSSLNFPNPCAEFEAAPMEGFDKERYVGNGNWYMHQMFDVPDSVNYDCYLRYMTQRPDGNYNLTEILSKPGLPTLGSVGVIIFDQSNIGRFTFSSEDIPQFNGQYLVLGTDYDNYAVEFGCKDVSGGSTVQLYITTRKRIVTRSTQNKIDEVIDHHHFDTTAIRTLKTASCPSHLKGSDGLVAGLLKLVTELLGGLLG